MCQCVKVRLISFGAVLERSRAGTPTLAKTESQVLALQPALVHQGPSAAALGLTECHVPFSNGALVVEVSWKRNPHTMFW